jgi:SAM-dependent methyltransferase
MKHSISRSTKLFHEVLKIDFIRNYYCWFRYQLRKGRMRTIDATSDEVGQHTIEHNKAALNARAGFGMANRMALLLYPVAAALRGSAETKVLIVGPRTEDDLFWAKALGMRNVRGLDLFSYSDMIDVGDMHQTEYPSAHFDAVILGWVISYSADPLKLIQECKRILKPGGYLGFGIESNPEHRKTGVYKPPRANGLNSARDIASLVNEPVTFIHDPALDVPTDNAVVFMVQ